MFELFDEEQPEDPIGESMEMHVPTTGTFEIGDLGKDKSYFLKVQGCDEKLEFKSTCPATASRSLTSECEVLIVAVLWRQEFAYNEAANLRYSRWKGLYR